MRRAVWAFMIAAGACSSTEPLPYRLPPEGREAPAFRPVGPDAGGIVARVNGRAVTDYDLDQELPLPMRDPAKRGDPRTAELRRRTLQRLVEERILVDAALNEKIHVSEERIDEEIRKERESAGLTPEEFKRQVETQTGRPYDMYVERTRERLMILDLIRRQLTGGALYVPPREFREEYDRNPDTYVEEEAVSYQAIVVPAAREGGAARAQELAGALRRQLERGADFVAVARRYHRDGAEAGRVHEMVPRGKLPPDVENILFDLGPQGVSPALPYEGENWAVFRVLDRRERRQRAFEEADLQTGIHSQLFNGKYNAKRLEILLDYLRRATIEPPDLFPPGYPKELEAVPDAPDRDVNEGPGGNPRE